MFEKIKELYNRGMDFLASKFHWLVAKLAEGIEPVATWLTFKSAPKPTMKEVTVAFLSILACIAVGTILGSLLAAMIHGLTIVLALVLPLLLANLIALAIVLVLYGDVSYRASRKYMDATVTGIKETVQAAAAEAEPAHA